MTLERVYEGTTAGEITIKMDDSLGLGGTLWDASLTLAEYLEKLGPETFKGKRVIELGSGTGFVGIVLARLGASVIITDLEPLLPLIRENVERNCPSSSYDNIRIEKLDWAEGATFDFEKPLHYVVGADVVYPKLDLHPLLKQTLDQLVAPSTTVILSHELRDSRDLSFYQLIADLFSVQKIPMDQLGENYRCEEIAVLHIKRKR